MNHSYILLLSFFLALAIAATDASERTPLSNQYCVYDPKCNILVYPGKCCYEENGRDCPVTYRQPPCTILTEADEEDSEIIVMEQILVVGGGGSRTIKGLRG